jgi:alkylation response protein AidB-like acyl-CoA dehydrogenase
MEANEIVQAAAGLTDTIKAAADAIEQQGRLPDAVLEALRASSIMRIGIPKSVGGLQAHPWTNTLVMEELAAADASTGWVTMITTGTSMYVSSYLSDARCNEVFGSDGSVVGFVGARGLAVPVEGGYKVSGRWPYGSGSLHARYLASGCLVQSPDGLRLAADGKPEWRSVVFPAAKAEIIETWDALGLRGTGSHDYTVAELFVPEDMTFSLQELPTRREPLYRYRGMFLANMAGVPLGVARGALEDAYAILSASPAKDNPRVQAGIAHAQATIESARSYFREAVDELWDALTSGDGEPPKRACAKFRLALTYVYESCADGVIELQELLGSATAHKGHPLERRIRDIMTMKLHAHTGPRNLEPIGRTFLGMDAAVPFFE